MILLETPISAFAPETSAAFLLQVYLPIAIWLFGMLALFVLLLKKYTFGNWTKEHPNPYDSETLGLPRGFFRGLLTMSLLYITIVLELVNVYMPDFEFQISEFLVAFQMMIAFYFGSKVMHHITSADREKTTIIAEATGGGTPEGNNTDQAMLPNSEMPADGVAEFDQTKFQGAQG